VRRSVGVGAIAVMLALAGGARANEFCVAPATGCAGGQQSTLQAGLDAAVAALGPDTVRLAAGVVNGPGAYNSANPDNTVTLVGAGRDATVVTSATTAAIIDLRNNATVTDLTVRGPNPPVALQDDTLIVGTVDRVAFASISGGGVTSINGTGRHLLVTGPPGLHINGTLEDADLIGASLYTGTTATVLRRVRSVGPYGVGGQNSSLVISSSLFVSTDPNGTIVSSSTSPVPNSHATTVLSNVTLIGGGGAGCVGFVAAGDNGLYTAPDDFTVQNATLANSIVRNCATTLNRVSTGGNRTANLTVFNSDIDLSPTAVMQSGMGTLTAGPGDGNLNTDPLFVGLPSLEYLLRSSSPLVDRGLTNAVSPQESTTDLNGDPRVVDGNGDGTAKRDVGAFEYQRRPPAVTTSVAPATAEIGQAVALSGSATEADPGETVTGLAWRFDDGATATGATASHAFKTAGAHTATLSATDSAGATGTATAAITVLARPSVRSLSLSPTTFRAATKGGSAVASAATPVGTKVRVGVTRRTAVKFTVQRRTSGRRSKGGRCVATTKRNRGAKRCTRYVAVRGSFSRKAGAKSTFKFTGRLNGRRLSTGRYRLSARAGTTPVKTRAFRIVR
jgi:PKD repeat protein